MSYGDKELAESCGLERLPEGSFCLPILYGNNAGRFALRAQFMGGGGHRGGTVNSMDEGLAEIAEVLESGRRGWREKVIWRLRGDVSEDDARQRGTPRTHLSGAQMAVVYHGVGEPKTGQQIIDDYVQHGGDLPDIPKSLGVRDVLRHNRGHYVVRRFGIQKNRGGCGFGGRVFRWCWLDDPENIMHESNDVFWQGEIPDEFAELLPDNVEFIESVRPTVFR